MNIDLKDEEGVPILNQIIKESRDLEKTVGILEQILENEVVYVNLNIRTQTQT